MSDPLSEQVVTVTVIVVPDEADGVNVQPVAVPAFERSPASMPEVGSVKVSVKSNELAAEGEVAEDEKAVTAGPTRSSVSAGVASDAVAGAVVPAASATAFAASRGTSVPEAEQVVTVIVYASPDPLTANEPMDGLLPLQGDVDCRGLCVHDCEETLRLMTRGLLPGFFFDARGDR